MRALFALSFALVTGLAAAPVRAQAPAEKPAEGNLEAYIEVLRSDVRTSKTALVTQALELTDGEAGAFWPVYREYDAALAKIWDKRIALLKEYAQGFGSIDEKKADDLAHRSLKLDEERNDLRRKYYDKIKKVVPSQKAARWLQVENRVGLLIDLKLASELPLLR